MQASSAETISYIGSGIFYVGSHFGDSQVLQIVSGDGPESRLNVLDSTANLAPIVDAVIVDLDGSGQVRAAKRIVALMVIKSKFLGYDCYLFRRGEFWIPQSGAEECRVRRTMRYAHPALHPFSVAIEGCSQFIVRLLRCLGLLDIQCTSQA